MCLFVVCTTQLVGSQFWDQGLNWGHSSEITEKRKSRIGRLTDIFFFFAMLQSMEDLSLRPGIEPSPPAVGAQSL